MLRSLHDLARFDAFRAHLHPAIASAGKLDANRLKVRVKPASGLVVSVGYVVAKLRTFSADVAALSHMFIIASVQRGKNVSSVKNSKTNFITV
jgi:hypothetical protein